MESNNVGWGNILFDYDNDGYLDIAADVDDDRRRRVGAVPGGSGLYFLVRGENACPDGVGSLGTDSNGVDREAVACP